MFLSIFFFPLLSQFSLDPLPLHVHDIMMMILCSYRRSSAISAAFKAGGTRNIQQHNRQHYRQYRQYCQQQHHDVVSLTLRHHDSFFYAKCNIFITFQMVLDMNRQFSMHIASSDSFEANRQSARVAPRRTVEQGRIHGTRCA